MQQEILIQNSLDTGVFYNPAGSAARIQDEAISSRKKFALVSIKTNTSSPTASLCALSVALISAVDVTAAGIDDFVSNSFAKEFAKVSDRFKDVAKIPGWWLQQSDYIPASATTPDLISFIRNHVQLTYSASLANRINVLHRESIEEAPEQDPISVDSLQSFISFITKESRLGEPEVVLTYTGNIRAEWHKSRKKHFAVEFLPNGQVRYVVFASDPDRIARTDRTSGLVSAETLMAKVEPFNVLAWSAS